MNDTFLPGNGFDTYEEQDRVLMGLSGSVRSGVAVRILQQQGFAVAAAVVRLADTPEEHAAVDAARALAKKLDVECVTLNAEALAGQDAEAARFAALLTAADKLGIQYIASGRYARIETDAQGMSHLFAPESGAPDESGKLAALPPEVLSRLIQLHGGFVFWISSGDARCRASRGRRAQGRGSGPQRWRCWWPSGCCGHRTGAAESSHSARWALR